MHSLSLAQIVLTICAGALAGGLITVIGVWGCEKLQNRRLAELEGDLISLRSNFVRYQKTQAGLKGVQAREEKASIEKQAQEHLASNKGNGEQSPEDWVKNG